MCDTCRTAELELEAFLEELENKHPGGEVDGVAVGRGHHVFVALYVQTIKRAEREERELMERRGTDTLSTAFAQLLMNGQKISEGN